MSDPFPPSEPPRIYFNAAPFVRRMGCGLGFVGLIFVIFFGGGLLGLMILGWKTLLGL